MTRFALLLLLCLTTVPVESLAREIGPETLRFPNAAGEVYFQHRQHQKRNRDCLTCHHQGAGTRCRDCHGQSAVVKGKTAPPFEIAAHKRCGGCHDLYRQRNQPSGPGTEDCAGCHQNPELKP